MTDFTMRRRDVLATGLAAAAVAATGLPARAAALPKNIMDGQVHIWKAGGPKPSPTGRQDPLSAEQLFEILDTGGVKQAVIITPSWSHDGSNSYPLEMAVKYPDRLKVMGLYFDWNKPANPSQIENWTKAPGMVGIRMFLGAEASTKWLNSSDSDWIWALLEKNNIPLMMSAANSIPRLTEIVQKHPGLRMCLDSFGVAGLPGIGAKGFENYGPVLAMAKYPNVIIKCASVPFLSGEPFPYKNLQPAVKQTYDAFGPDRMIFASDVTLLKGSYKDCVNFWTQLDFLKEADLVKIMGGNLSKWINWPLAA
jgi:predicted TIM-barrel fold metal-dependent hydrolase